MLRYCSRNRNPGNHVFMWLGESERVSQVIHDHLSAHHFGSPIKFPVGKRRFEKWHSISSSEMHRTTHCLFGRLKNSSPQRVTPSLLPALTGQLSLRHGHQVVSRTMSQYKYADVRRYNANENFRDQNVDVA